MNSGGVESIDSSTQDGKQDRNPAVMTHLAAYIPKPDHQSLNALTAQLVLIRALGQPHLLLQDLRRDWQRMHFLHIPVDGLYLIGTLSLSAALEQQGIATENCPVSSLDDLEIDVHHRDTALAWLTTKVSGGCGVLVNLEVYEVTALKNQYAEMALQPNYGHTVIVVGIQRDSNGDAQMIEVLDPALLQPHQQIPLDEFMMAWMFRGFEGTATADPLPIPLRRIRQGLS